MSLGLACIAPDANGVQIRDMFLANEAIFHFPYAIFHFSYAGEVEAEGKPVL